MLSWSTLAAYSTKNGYCWGTNTFRHHPLSLVAVGRHEQFPVLVKIHRGHGALARKHLPDRHCRNVEVPLRFVTASSVVTLSSLINRAFFPVLRHLPCVIVALLVVLCTLLRACEACQASGAVSMYSVVQVAVFMNMKKNSHNLKGGTGTTYCRVAEARWR